MKSTLLDVDSKVTKNRSSQVAHQYGIPEKIKKAENIRIFKKEIKIHFNMRTSQSKEFPLDHTHDGFFGKILIQIKLKLSPLRSQLFNYNLIDNPFCPACNDCIETPIHFFIDCQAFHIFRQTMLSKLHDLNPHLVSPNDIVELILDGSKSGNRDHRTRVNKAIFRHVCNFIYKTKRFTQNANK